MRLWLQLILIPAVALLGAGVSAVIHDRPELEELQSDEWARSAEDVGAMDNPLWIDARPADIYAKGHVDGAINVSLDAWESGFEELVMAWQPGQNVVVYCNGEGCQLSRETAERLRAELGVDEVYWLQGGIEAWEGRAM